MPTVSKSIGTTPELIAAPKKEHLLDIIIQNLSANNIYVGSSDEVSTTTGIEVAPNGSYSNDKRKEPVVLIADAAASDVRVQYEEFREGTR